VLRAWPVSLQALELQQQSVRQYQALWAEMHRLRQTAHRDPRQQTMLAAAPRAAANRMDAFRSFAHYPTDLIQDRTRVPCEPRPRGDLCRVVRPPAVQLRRYGAAGAGGGRGVEALLAPLAQAELAMRELAARAGLDLGATALTVSVLAKMGRQLRPPDA
jgi:hypothetical protein